MLIKLPVMFCSFKHNFSANLKTIEKPILNGKEKTGFHTTKNKPHIHNSNTDNREKLKLYQYYFSYINLVRIII